MRRHHKRGTARFGCLRRFCLSTHSESFGVIRWPECDCVCAGVGLSGGRGRLLTHVHRASACTLNAVGLLPVSGRGDARVAPPCPTTLCVWRNLPTYLPTGPKHCTPEPNTACTCSLPALLCSWNAALHGTGSAANGDARSSSPPCLSLQPYCVS